MIKFFTLGSVLITVLISPVYSQGFFGFKPGGAENPVSGSASGTGGNSSAPSLEICEKSFGTIAVVQPQDQISAALQRYNLPPPNNLLRLMIQQSKCFQVVERGIGMQNIMQERQLSDGGQLQSGSNIGRGQLVTADFILTPEVNFSENNTGGAAIGAISGLFGVAGAIVGAVASGIKFKQASTTLIMADSRSGLQVAAAEGSVEKADWSAGAFLGGVGAGAYTNTAEGKVVAAALLDNYNNIIKAIKNQPSLIMSSANAESSNNAKQSLVANAFNDGDILKPKINGIKIFTDSNSSSKSIQSLTRDDELVYLGVENNGFLKVQGSNGEGWIDKRMASKK